MLGNNEEIQGLDLAEVFEKMLEELSWADLRTYVQANSQLAKLCMVGGHRLNPKRRSRIEKLVVREAEKNEYSQTGCNGVFAIWYPVHKELHGKLEEHFHSDKYETYRKRRKLEEDEYVLTAKAFDTFFNLHDLQAWRILLAFSPLKFTEAQAKKILDKNRGNAELLEKAARLQVKIGELEKHNVQLDTDAQRSHQKQKKDSVGAQESKKLVRQLRTSNAALEKKLEVAQTESRKLREALGEAGKDQKTLLASSKKEIDKATRRLRTDLDRVAKELADWKGKYEQQRVENKSLMESIREADKRRDTEIQRAEKAHSECEYLDSFANLILSRIDWAKVGQQLKLTPTLRRQYNSLMRKLHYEDDHTLSIEATLPEFWDGLMTLEKGLIKSIAESNTREVMAADVESYWRALTDVFADVAISLEARLIMLKMLQDIFYQVLDMEDLETDLLPKAKKAK